MTTVLEAIQSGTGYLEKAGTESPRLSMEHLLAHLLECPRVQLYVDFDRPLEEATLAPLRELMRRRRTGEPLQHLLGSVEFFGRKLRTDARALVPRPETEELVQQVLAMAKDMPKPIRLLDMGTGSGAIGLTMTAELGDEVSGAVLADISADALTLAQENAETLGLANRVSLVESDLFSALHDQFFDLVTANLPYVASGEMGGLSIEVKHDPALALDGGKAGTEIMERFIAETLSRLNPGGRIAMEIGSGQGETLAGSLEDNGFDKIKIGGDLSGNERFVFAARPHTAT